MARNRTCLFGLLLYCITSGMHAEQGQAQQPEALKSPIEVEIERISALESEIQQRTDLDDATKAAIIERYKEALERLKLANEWIQQSKQFDEDRKNAPERQTQVQAELDKLKPEVKVEPPADASLQQLETLAADAEAKLRAARDEVAALDAERARRNERRTNVPNAAASAQQRLQKVEEDLAVSPPADEHPELTKGKRASLQALKKSLEREIEAYKNEIDSYDARRDLLTKRIELARNALSQAEKQVQQWQPIVSERRREETRKLTEEAERVKREAEISEDPVIVAIAKENADWAAKIDKLNDRIAKATSRVTEINQLLDSINKQSKDIKSRVNAAGLTSAMGLLLRRRLEKLPDEREFQQLLRQTQAEITQVEIDLIDTREQDRILDDVDARTEELIEEFQTPKNPEQLDALKGRIRELLTKQREFVTGLEGDYNTYSDRLVDLDSVLRNLLTQTTALREYIDEHILWTRSGLPPTKADIEKTAAGLEWLASPNNWMLALQSCWNGLRLSPMRSSLILIVFLTLFAAHRPFLREIETLGETAAKPTCSVVGPTVMAVLLSLLVALTWPVLFWWAAWSIGRLETGEFVSAVASGLFIVGGALFSLEAMRQLFRPGGVINAHFGWSNKAARQMSRNLTPLLLIGVPMWFVVAAVESTQDDDRVHSLGRAAFVIGRIVVAFAAFQILHPKRTICRDRLAANPERWLARRQRMWFLLGIGAPLVLVGLSLAGYHYTAIRVSERIGLSILLILVVLFANAFALRFLLVSRRRLAIQHARQRIPQKETAAVEESRVTKVQTAEPQIQLAAIDAQSRRLFQTVAILGIAAGLFWVWADTVPALGLLDRITLWSTTTTVYEPTAESNGTVGAAARTAEVAVSLADLGAALLFLLITIIAARNLPGLLEILLLRQFRLASGERYAVITITRYLVVIIGTILAFQSLGVGWSKVQWLVAAMTVGLGFGLQEIFANFVSGLILLFERPIRIGDPVTVGENEGVVSRIQIRATTVTDWNLKEVVIPNKEFVTGRVINWALTDSKVRVVIPVGIAYGSDTRRAAEVLLEVARNDPRVLDDPAPAAFFLEFGDSALNFELRVFVKDVSDFLAVRHNMHMAVDAAFREAGIEIAFPQRDIHIRSIPDALFPGQPKRESE